MSSNSKNKTEKTEPGLSVVDYDHSHAAGAASAAVDLLSMALATPGCDDSGHYDSSSNASDCCNFYQPLDRLSSTVETASVRYQHMLRDKEASLMLALQDARKLRSELERLSKSEQWYKQELKTQKLTRLEAMERLYTQERKYIEENQRLQRECVRLYGKCAKLEQELATQRDKEIMRMAKEKLSGGGNDGSADMAIGRDFELEQQQAIIADQMELIQVLRRQKRALLEDLKRLNEEKDAKVLELQRAMASLETENERITHTCKKLIDERNHLEERIQIKDREYAEECEDKLKLQQSVAELREQLADREAILAGKEQEIEDLREEFASNIHHETHMDEVHRLSEEYHHEISAKLKEIAVLRASLLLAQQEVAALGDLQAANEEKDRVIEHLNSSMEDRSCELENLRRTDAMKTLKLDEIRADMLREQNERQRAEEELSRIQAKVLASEQSLASLTGQYATLRELYQSCKFELEMRQIEQGKMEFKTKLDGEDIAGLKTKLREYMEQTKCLSERVALLDGDLRRSYEENARIREAAVREWQRREDEKPNSDDEESGKESYVLAETDNQQSEEGRLEQMMGPGHRESSDASELSNLRAKVSELQEKLQQFNGADEDKRLRRIKLIKEILEKQNSNIANYQKAEKEWEDVVKTIRRSLTPSEDHQQQQQQQQYEWDYEDVNNDGEGDVAIETKAVNVESSLEARAESMSPLQNEISRLLDERAEQQKRLQTLERLLADMQASKRHAIVIPSESEADAEAEVAAAYTTDRLHILAKISQGEYNRRIQKYDAHVRSLVGNVKSLKKSLKTANRKICQLSAKQAKQSNVDRQELQMTRRHLEEMRSKYEQSQHQVKSLEEELIGERRKYEASDLGKSLIGQGHQESRHEVANLIDDYKKLIHQSAIATRRCKTSEILDLIERSDRYVPNLQKLEASVGGLFGDIKEFLNQYTTTTTHLNDDDNGYDDDDDVYAIAQSKKVQRQRSTVAQPSLMDELLLAANGGY